MGEPMVQPELTPEERHIIVLLRHGPQLVAGVAAALQTSVGHAHQTASRLCGASSFLVRASWLSYLSQTLWVAVHVLSPLLGVISIKSGQYLSGRPCVSPRRRMDNFTPPPMSPKVTMTQVIMTRTPYRCAVGLMIETDEVSEQDCI